jgi:hypothetical protein
MDVARVVVEWLRCEQSGGVYFSPAGGCRGLVRERALYLRRHVHPGGGRVLSCAATATYTASRHDVGPSRQREEARRERRG